MSARRVASNLEWQAWGKHDPLYGVAAWRGKEKGGAVPWTDAEFYEMGRRDWEWFHARWQEYGVDHAACVEIGCGAGRITRQLIQHFRIVHALDVSPDMLTYARQRVSGDGLKFHLTEGANFPVEDESVSAIFSCHVFQHFDTLEIGHENFREIFHVLSHGGTIMIHLPVRMWPRPVQLHEILHFSWTTMAKAKMSMNRVLLRAGLFRPVARTLFYPVNWLFRELQRIGFKRLELAVIAMGTDGYGMPFLFATKP